MTTKKFLIFAPTVVILILLQSYFWVPTYDKQTQGNPTRLGDFIAGSIGDASILNPVLSADSSSSDINGMVFEGLIDRDDNLQFRGRLATNWELSEEAYFYVNDKAAIPEKGALPPKELIAFLRTHLRRDHLKDITLLPPRTFELKKKVPPTNKKDTPKEIRITAHAPFRIKLRLSRVDQELFEYLKAVLGKNYFTGFQAERYIDTDPPVATEIKAQYAKEILPATEHNPILVFHLRSGVRFHDGHMFDADDVKFTYDAIMNPANLSPRISDYEPIKSVEVVDKLTARIIYKRLYSPAIASWGMGILPEHLLNEDALTKEAETLGKDPKTFTLRHSKFNRQPVGCGPFQFSSWKSDQYVILDKFESYWEGPPNYERYIYRVIPSTLNQEMEFYAGTIDSYGAEPHQVKRLAQDRRFQNFSGTSYGYSYIGYNMRKAPFDDPRVRQALGMAIDVNKIIKYVLYDQGERITGPFVKQTDFYNHDIAPLPYDPEGAKALLKDAGWEPDTNGKLVKNGKPLQFTLITNNGNELRKAILAIAQDAWKDIGVDVQTDLLEWSVFIQERVNKLDFDALVLGWSMGIEPDLFQIWHSSQTNPYQLNFVGFKDPVADDLILKIRQEYDYDRQVAYCHQLHDIIAKSQPYTFLYVGKWTALLDKRIVIKKMDEMGQTSYKKITPTKTGSFRFHFNKWIKLDRPPVFSDNG